jgi:hypothetical protein
VGVYALQGSLAAVKKLVLKHYELAYELFCRLVVE